MIYSIFTKEVGYVQNNGSQWRTLQKDSEFFFYYGCCMKMRYPPNWCVVTPRWQFFYTKHVFLADIVHFITFTSCRMAIPMSSAEVMKTWKIDACPCLIGREALGLLSVPDFVLVIAITHPCHTRLTRFHFLNGVSITWIVKLAVLATQGYPVPSLA